MMTARAERALEQAGISEFYFVERLSTKAWEAHLGAECWVSDEDVERVQEAILTVRRCEIRERDGKRYVWVNRYTPERETEIIEKYHLQ